MCSKLFMLGTSQLVIDLEILNLDSQTSHKILNIGDVLIQVMFLPYKHLPKIYQDRNKSDRQVCYYNTHCYNTHCVRQSCKSPSMEGGWQKNGRLMCWVKLPIKRKDITQRWRPAQHPKIAPNFEPIYKAMAFPCSIRQIFFTPRTYSSSPSRRLYK